MPRKFTYGPFKSRRLGLSLGIDVLPQSKKCTFNCVYCEIGNTKPNQLVSPEITFTSPPPKGFRKELNSLFKYIKDLDSITFGYNGEPTLNENLEEFFRIAYSVRNKIKWKDKVPKLTLFTNSSTLYKKEVRKRMRNFDLILAKLDTATQDDFLRTNRPHQDVPSINQIIESIAKLKKELSEKNELAIQSLLYQSYKNDFISNTNEKNIQSLANAINKINPNLVQLYSIARIPAEYYVYALDEDKLKKIAKKLRKSVSSETKIYCY